MIQEIKKDPDTIPIPKQTLEKILKCKLEKRSIKAKIDPYDGKIIEDLGRYDAIVAETMLKIKSGDEAYKAKQKI